MTTTSKELAFKQSGNSKGSFLLQLHIKCGAVYYTVKCTTQGYLHIHHLQYIYIYIYYICIYQSCGINMTFDTH